MCCGSQKVIVELSEFGLSSPEKAGKTSRTAYIGCQFTSADGKTDHFLNSLIALVRSLSNDGQSLYNFITQGEAKCRVVRPKNIHKLHVK